MVTSRWFKIAIILTEQDSYCFIKFRLNPQLAVEPNLLCLSWEEAHQARQAHQCESRQIEFPIAIGRVPKMLVITNRLSCFLTFTDAISDIRQKYF